MKISTTVFISGIILILLFFGSLAILRSPAPNPPQTSAVIVSPRTAPIQDEPSTPAVLPAPVAAAAYAYNAQGQLSEILYPDGSVYTYAYDSHGNKIRETDRKSKTWTYLYDEQQHPIAIYDPDGRVIHLPSNAGQK